MPAQVFHMPWPAEVPEPVVGKGLKDQQSVGIRRFERVLEAVVPCLANTQVTSRFQLRV